MTAKKKKVKASTKPKKVSARPKAKAETKTVSMEDRFKIFEGNILGDQYDIDRIKKLGQYDRVVKRKMRYWCFKIRHATVKGKTRDDIPDGLKEFVEGLKGFAGWKYFAETWDIHGINPFMIVMRLQSVWVEWEHIMDRVSIPIDTPPEQLHDRIQALTDEFARKEANKK